VVTPSYNQSAFVEETIRSVLLQGYPDLEYIVMDGGSTDGSPEIVRKYARWLAHWTSEPDSGQAHALNKGFERASGELWAWLNSDDLYTPGALFAAAEAFLRRPEAALIYGDAEQISRDGAALGRAPQVRAYDRRYLLAESNLIAQPSAFFRGEAFRAVGGLDPTLHVVMDWDLWLRLDGQGPICYIPTVLSCMRLYPEAKTFSSGRGLYVELHRMIARHGGQELPAYFEARLREAHLNRAFEAYLRGDAALGQEELGFVMQVSPGWQNDPWLLPQTLADWAWSLASDLAAGDAAPVAFAERVCRRLPAAAAAPALVRRRTLGLLYQAMAFRSRDRGQPQAVRRYAWQAVAHDAGRVRNRGLWSIVLRSLFGPRSAAAARPQDKGGRVTQ
jgi:hypothetical protein